MLFTLERHGSDAGGSEGARGAECTGPRSDVLRMQERCMQAREEKALVEEESAFLAGEECATPGRRVRSSRVESTFLPGGGHVGPGGHDVAPGCNVHPSWEETLLSWVESTSLQGATQLPPGSLAASSMDRRERSQESTPILLLPASSPPWHRVDPSSGRATHSRVPSTMHAASRVMLGSMARHPPGRASSPPGGEPASSWVPRALLPGGVQLDPLGQPQKTAGTRIPSNHLRRIIFRAPDACARRASIQKRAYSPAP